MEMKNYTDGNRTIRATEVMYNAVYKEQGFKPCKAGVENDKGRGNKRDTAKDTSVETADDGKK